MKIFPLTLMSHFDRTKNLINLIGQNSNIINQAEKSSQNIEKCKTPRAIAIRRLIYKAAMLKKGVK